MECATISVASVPILADGIKWLGYSPKHKFLWNSYRAGFLGATAIAFMSGT